MTIQVLGAQVVDGVNCVKVRRVFSNNAANYSDTWLAQDTTGNIWQLRNYDNPYNVTDEDDVIFMPANPPLGAQYILFSIYSTEYVVSSVTTTVSTPLGTYHNCTVFSNSDGGLIETDYVSPGIGVVKLAYAGNDNGAFTLAALSGFTPATPPAITTHPASQLVVRTNGVNSATMFAVVANGGGSLTYQWRLNGTNLFGKTNAALALTDVRRTNSGSYSVVVSNLGGTVASSNATLRVITPTRFRTPLRLDGGNIRLFVADAEGLPYVAGFLPSLEFYATTNPILTATQWTRLTGNESLSNGVLSIDDIAAGQFTNRFYYTIEH